jgi:hypothetical protein
MQAVCKEDDDDISRLEPALPFSVVPRCSAVLWSRALYRYVLLYCAVLQYYALPLESVLSPQIDMSMPVA